MSLIASVLRLDRHDVHALKITDPYSLHRVVYSLYEPTRTDPNTPSGFLFADKGGDVRGRQVLMLSNRAPAEAIDGQYGNVESKPIPDTFLNHGAYRFEVVVNPTKRNNETKKLIPIKGRGPIANWFADRAAQQWGFEVIEQHLQIDRVNVLKFKAKNGHQITQAQAHVNGMLRVSDRKRFTDSFKNGIGRGRAFGCGLLQIVPIDQKEV